MGPSSRRGSYIGQDLQVLAKDRVPNATIRTPERQPQFAQSLYLSFGSFNTAVNDLAVVGQ
jgi:hypothetical protein